jgi:hypothetical protein
MLITIIMTIIMPRQIRRLASSPPLLATIQGRATLVTASPREPTPAAPKLVACCSLLLLLKKVPLVLILSLQRQLLLLRGCWLLTPPLILAN